MDIMVIMCEDCMKKVKGRVFKGASRNSSGKFLGYCVACKCFNEATFFVNLRLPERKVGE